MNTKVCYLPSERRKKDILTPSKAKIGPWDKWFTKKMGYLPIQRGVYHTWMIETFSNANAHMVQNKI